MVSLPKTVNRLRVNAVLVNRRKVNRVTHHYRQLSTASGRASRRSTLNQFGVRDQRNETRYTRLFHFNARIGANNQRNYYTTQWQSCKLYANMISQWFISFVTLFMPPSVVCDPTTSFNPFFLYPDSLTLTKIYSNLLYRHSYIPPLWSKLLPVLRKISGAYKTSPLDTSAQVFHSESINCFSQILS